MSDATSNTNFTPARCTQCGATVNVDPTMETAFCTYCGTKFVVEKAINNFNVQQMEINHVDSVNIVKPSAVDSVLKFADKQIDRLADEKRRKEEEVRIQQEKNNAFFKKYWWLFVAFLAVLFIFIFWNAANENRNSKGKISIGISSSDLVGQDYKAVISDLEEAGFTNVKTEPIDDLITGWLKKDGEVSKIDIDGVTIFSSSSKFDAGVKIIVFYHTFPEEASTTTEITEQPENTTTTTSNTTTNTDETTNISEQSVYDYAYIKVGQEYSIYYLIDVDNKNVKCFTTDDTTPFTGTFTGDLNNGIDIQYSVDDIHEQIRFVGTNDDSSIIVTDPNGFEWPFIKTSVAEAEKIMK